MSTVRYQHGACYHAIPDLQCPLIVYTDLNGLICKITEEPPPPGTSGREVHRSPAGAADSLTITSSNSASM